MKQVRILQVGCGNLGKALLSAWAQSELLAQSYVVQPSKAAKSLFDQFKNIQFVSNLSELPPDFQPEVIVFTNKPQQASEILPQYARFASNQSMFISVMSGLSLDGLSKLLGNKISIVRLMPNLAAQVRQSMTVGVCNQYVSTMQKELTQHLGQAIGQLLWVSKENLLEAAAPISGSGPAYFFLLAECFAQTAEKLGFDKTSAQQLASQTLLGSALLVKEAGKDLAQLRREVSSKGGITLAALEMLNKDEPLSERVHKAVLAGIERDRQLAQ